MARGIDKRTLRKEREITKCKVKCDCGCVSLITHQRDWIICRWCHNKLYRTPQIKFKYEMKEKLNK